MALFFRKIDRAKWTRSDTGGDEDVPADAITVCMKTKDNTLSIWKVDSEQAVDEAALALASNKEHLEAIDIVQIDVAYLEQNGINYIQEDGLTNVGDLKKNHLNLIQLSYKKLGIIAYHIADKIKDDKVKRYTKSKLKEIIKKAIYEDRLKFENLSNSMKQKLG